MDDNNIRIAVAPKERFASALKRIHDSTMVCDQCGNPVQAMCHPYAYDENNNYMWYMPICQKCGEIMYTTD